MRIAIGSDHRGVNLKRRLIETLERQGHQVTDHGTHNADSVDYPDIAGLVSRDVAGREAERGILICGTGIGMSIAANKVPGVRAALCSDELTAELSRRHNDANVLCLPGDMMGERNIDQLVETWLRTEFEGGRHARRVDKVAEIENDRCS